MGAGASPLAPDLTAAGALRLPVLVLVLAAGPALADAHATKPVRGSTGVTARVSDMLQPCGAACGG